MSELDGLYRDHVAALEVAYGRACDGVVNERFDGVAIHSGSPVKRSEFDDQFWPLRPVPHWQHWLPLAEPDDALVLRSGVQPKLVRQTSRSFWERPAALESDDFLASFEVLHVADAKAAAEHFGGGRVAFIGED